MSSNDYFFPAEKTWALVFLPILYLLIGTGAAHFIYQTWVQPRPASLKKIHSRKAIIGCVLVFGGLLWPIVLVGEVERRTVEYVGRTCCGKRAKGDARTQQEDVEMGNRESGLADVVVNGESVMRVHRETGNVIVPKGNSRGS